MTAKNKAKGKKEAKKAKATTETGKGAAEVTQRPSLTEPWSWLPDWFEHWPPNIGRRVPDVFAEMTLADTIRVEERREDDTVVIRAEIPGVDPDQDIDVSVADGKLTISARREQREETKTDDSCRSEFRYGSFKRTMSVPAGTRSADVKATYQDGILEVRVPINEAVEAEAKVPVTRKT